MVGYPGCLGCAPYDASDLHDFIQFCVGMWSDVYFVGSNFMVPALAGCGTVGVEPGDSVLISRANGGGQDI